MHRKNPYSKHIYKASAAPSGKTTYKSILHPFTTPINKPSSKHNENLYPTDELIHQPRLATLLIPSQDLKHH